MGAVVKCKNCYHQITLFSSRFHPLSLSLSLSALLSCFLFKSHNSNGFDGTNSPANLSSKISSASTQSLFLPILFNQSVTVRGCAHFLFLDYIQTIHQVQVHCKVLMRVSWILTKVVVLFGIISS
ncbi:hypothetical protein L2E82_35511 [Cichorium intybus]|uniref:Uncharacterized protein n=1 Tax=Cichorium intybus TaxID=13427 RepID=A0ACB9BNZ7_CICIN|nr:hypothetical protein L2E82_35511 [Cichorium intybus]